jgi:dienelactone hydrolase
MIHKNFTLMNSDSELIRLEAHYREDVKDAPIVVICHGFKGFKDWGFFPVLADTLASDGYFVITFNFSRNGIGSDLQNFTELELFSKNTYTHELKDLACIFDALMSKNIGKGMADPERIGLLGHSRGGGIALLYAQRDSRVNTLVTWSAISTVHRYTPDQIKEWKNNGFIEIENKRTGQLMRVTTDLLNDIEKNKKDLDILSAAGKIEIPTLIIHGQEDESVPVEEAQAIYDHLLTPSKELIIIEDGTHTFGAGHPLESRPEALEVAFDLTENWFDRYLL